MSRIRIDKWLWAARFYRTRSLAAAAVEAGQVRIGGERIKPAHGVHIGDSVVVRKAGFEWVVAVLAVDDRRGAAAHAATLYRETDASRATRETELERRRAAAATEPRFDGRPTKRDRRRLEEFLDEK